MADEPITDRELDLVMALEVMCVAKPEPLDFAVVRHWSTVPNHGGAWFWDYREDIRGTWQPFFFSSDIAAAMAVVEKMRDNGWSVEISSDIDWSMQEPEKEWSVGFQKRNPEAMWMVDESGNADSLSLPKAISQAALAAVRESLPEGK